MHQGMEEKQSSEKRLTSSACGRNPANTHPGAVVTAVVSSP